MNTLSITSKLMQLTKTCGKHIISIHNNFIQSMNELDKLTELYKLQNQVTTLSTSSVSNLLVHTLKEIAYTQTESNTDFICEHLKYIIEDLLKGVDEMSIIMKYDSMLYNIKNKDKLDRISKYLDEIHQYKHCYQHKGEICLHNRCKYAVWRLSANNCITLRGREKEVRNEN